MTQFSFIKTSNMLATIFLIALSQQVSAGTHEPIVVCPAGTTVQNCDFSGNNGIQAAIDSARDHDTVLIKAGTYTPENHRDAPLKELMVRGYILIQNKAIKLIAENGVILDGANGVASSAIVIHQAQATIENLHITGFRYHEPEDNFYDGHGIFCIDCSATVTGVTIEKIKKMAISIAGNSSLTANSIRILDSHLGVWAFDNAKIELINSIIKNSESAGLAAYDKSITTVTNSVFDHNNDDGIYADENAVIIVTNTILTENTPFALNGAGESSVGASHSIVFSNSNEQTIRSEGPQVTLEKTVTVSDPKLDDHYWPLADSPAIGTGNPAVKGLDEKTSNIGLLKPLAFQ